MRRLTIPMLYALVAIIAVGGFLYARSWLFDPPPLVTRSVAPPATNVLTIHFHERPPYYVFVNGQVTGLCGDPAARALESAGIPHRWQRTPPQRQLRIIQQDQGLDAALGWYETPERRSFAHFSRPLYRDRPTVALLRDNDARFTEGMTVEQFLAVPNAVLLVKESYSYGDWLDERIRQLKPAEAVCTGDNVSMLRMVAEGRADFFFLAEEEAQELMALNPVYSTSLRLLHFEEMPPGEPRHLMFGKRVPQAWVERINVALLGTVPGAPTAP